MPDGLRLRALFDRTDTRPSSTTIWQGCCCTETPSRLWDARDRNYRRASLWTDVLLLRWLRSLPDGTVVVATRPTLIVLASRLAPAGVVVIAQEHQQLGRYAPDMRRDLAAALANASVVVTLTDSDRDAYGDMLGADRTSGGRDPQRRARRAARAGRPGGAQS